MLVTLNNDASLFLLRTQSFFVFDNDTQRHANKGAQKITVRRLLFLERRWDCLKNLPL